MFPPGFQGLRFGILKVFQNQLEPPSPYKPVLRKAIQCEAPKKAFSWFITTISLLFMLVVTILKDGAINQQTYHVYLWFMVLITIVTRVY